MESENINVELGGGPNDKHKRSASYPALTVTAAYSYASKINEKFSAAIQVTREEIAVAFGVHPNTQSRNIAASVHYGFLDKVEGKYRVSKLFLDIFRPESEKDKKLNLITAFGKPKLYQDLIAKFDGNVIPLELPNTLIKHHSITENAASDAADTFIKSATEVGVLGDNRVLRYNVTLSTVSKTQYAEIIDENPNPSKDGNSNNSLVTSTVVVDTPQYSHGNGDRKIPIHLTKNKMAYFIYPSDITSRDIQLVEYEVKGILLRLQLENDEEDSK